MSPKKFPILPFILSSFALNSCGQKNARSNETTSQSAIWNISETRALMGSALATQLTRAGLSESQAKIIVEKGKSTPASSALLLTSDEILAEVKAFTSGATDALKDVGTLPEGTSKKQFVKIIAGSNIKVMKDLKEKVPDLDLKKSVSAVSGAAVEKLDEAGFDATSIPSALKEITASVAENADDAGISPEELKDVVEDSFKQMMFSFKKIDGCDKSKFAEMLKEMSAGLMGSVMSFSGFESKDLKELAISVGRAAMKGADEMNDIDNASMLEFAKAVNSGLLQGAGEDKTFDKEHLGDISAGASSGMVNAAGEDAEFDREKLDDLMAQAKLGAEEAAEKLELDPSTTENLRMASESGSKEAAAEVPDYDTATLDTKIADAEKLAKEEQAKIDAEKQVSDTQGTATNAAATDPIPSASK